MRATLTRTRKIAYAAAAMLLALGAPAAMLLAADVYLHWRVQNLGAVNVWGYRGPTVGRKLPNQTRIVVLGGSTAFGYGVPYDEAFPAFLERKLNARSDGSRRYSVVNLGAPGQGAFGFRADLADYAYLRYDAVILYEGYNDLGMRDVPAAVPPRDTANDLQWRRQSPVFRATGYLPVLPLVFREKAMSIRAGGNLDAAYRGRAVFKPGLAARATAAALQSAAGVADAVGGQLGRLTAGPELSAQTTKVDPHTWRHYTGSVLSAVADARQRGAKVVVVTQPYASDSHAAQQRALAAALASAFGADPGVRYVNLGPIVDLRDRTMAYDGLHLVASGNERIADHLVDPIVGIIG